MNLVVTVQLDGERTVLVLSGELDVFGAELLEPWLTGDVVLDMADVTFIDSRGIRAIGRTAQPDSGCTARIRNPSASVRRVLDMVGLTTMCET